MKLTQDNKRKINMYSKLIISSICIILLALEGSMNKFINLFYKTNIYFENTLIFLRFISILASGFSFIKILEILLDSI